MDCNEFLLAQTNWFHCKIVGWWTISSVLLLVEASSQRWKVKKTYWYFGCIKCIKECRMWYIVVTGCQATLSFLWSMADFSLYSQFFSCRWFKPRSLPFIASKIPNDGLWSQNPFTNLQADRVNICLGGDPSYRQSYGHLLFQSKTSKVPAVSDSESSYL